jgi:hypothetical protein
VSWGLAIKADRAVSKRACVFALIAMAICGFAYKTIAYRLYQSADSKASLPVALKTFPIAIGDWLGKDIPLEQSVAQAAGNDDFCNRVYVNKNTNSWANVYIAYSIRPRTMLGHRPDACYVGAGWIHDSTEPSSFVSKSGIKIPCLLHRFHLPQPRQEELVVLNFYIINGQTSARESGFSGIEWRAPNINGDIAHYVAQVQISSALENLVRAAAADTADSILRFFPGENTKAEAVEDSNTILH